MATRLNGQRHGAFFPFIIPYVMRSQSKARCMRSSVTISRMVFHQIRQAVQLLLPVLLIVHGRSGQPGICLQSGPLQDRTAGVTAQPPILLGRRGPAVARAEGSPGRSDVTPHRASCGRAHDSLLMRLCHPPHRMPGCTHGIGDRTYM